MKTSSLKHVGQLTMVLMVSSSLCMVPLPAQAGEVKSAELTVATPAPKDMTATTSPTAPKAVEKQPLHISFNYLAAIGKGHTTPGALGQLSPAMEAMWKNLPITVIDAQGNTYEVQKNLNLHCERTVGNFANGEKVTIIVDDSQIPDGYNLSWESDYTYPKPIKNYAQFQAVVDSSTPIRISLAQMKVKFDLQGGTVNGNTKAPVNTVKKIIRLIFRQTQRRQTLCLVDGLRNCLIRNRTEKAAVLVCVTIGGHNLPFQIIAVIG